MVMAIPFAFAALGGALGASVGFTTAGISIGWLVGSWIMGPQNSKNDIFDPGAQELPQVNQSLRGVTMPVLFGTNKVSANIVWQNNFHYVKTETGGGGKGGGSGGGKSSAPASISYEYFIDIVYHLGMPYVPGDLLQVFYGHTKVSKTSLARFDLAISRTSSLSISSGKPYNKMRNNIPGDQSSGQPKLFFRDAVFFAGYYPEIGSWAYMDSKLQHHVIWPGTAWVGFRDLSLGASPQIPQLTFEMGPVSTTIDEVISDGWVTGNLTNNREFVGPGIKDVNGNIWVLSEHGLENGVATASVYSNTGTLLAEHSLSTLYAARRTEYSEYTFGYPVHSVGNHNAFISGEGTRLVVLTHAQGTFANPQTGFQFFHVYLIAADGSLTATGGVVQASTGDQPNTIQVGGTCIGQVGYGALGDYIFYLGPCATISEMQLVFAPSITQMEDVAFKGLKCNRYIYSTTSVGDIFAIFGKPAATCLPKLSSVSGQIEAWRFYSYFGKNVLTNPFSNAWITGTFAPAAPSGALIYFEFTVFGFEFVAGATSTTVTGSLASPVICTNMFTDSANVTFTFFSDDQTDFTTGGAQTLNNYAPTISTQLQVSDTALIHTVFHLSFEAESTWTATEKPIRVRLKGFEYDATTGIFGYSYSKDTNGGDLIDTYGGTNQPLLGLSQSAILMDGDDLTYLMFTNSNVTDHIMPNRILKIGIANIEYGAAEDLPPPLIIKEILTHPLFGMFPGQDIIDSASYTAAYNFCIARDILVSVMYRREETGQNIFELLLALYGGWLTIDSSTNKVKFGLMDLSPGSVRTIDNDHLVIKDDNPLPIKTAKSAAQDTYNLIRVNYFNRSMEYVQNQIEEGDEVDQDIHGVRLREFPAVFVMQERTAHRIALRALWTNLYPRETHSFTLGFKDADLEPGDLITLVDSFSDVNQVCQIVRWEENDRGQFDVVAQQQLYVVPGLKPSDISSAQWDFINNWDLSSSYTSQNSAYTPNRRGTPTGTDYVQAFELPREFEAGDRPQVRVYWLPKGPAQGASIHISPDGETYAPFGSTPSVPLGGRLMTDLSADPGIPMIENVLVNLYPATEYRSNSPVFYMDATLPEVTQATMHAGGGNFWCGSEMLAYAGVNLVSQNTYRLSRVYRGWGGTDIGAHSSGDYWVRRSPANFAYEYAEEDIGTTMYFKIIPLGGDPQQMGTEHSVTSATAFSYTITGRGYKPQLLANVQVSSYRGDRTVNVGSGNNIDLFWHESARLSGWGAGAYGTNAQGYGGYISDVDSLGYFCNVVRSGGVNVRSTYVSTPTYTYTNSQNFADNGAWRGDLSFRITPTNPMGNHPVTRVVSIGVF